MEVLILERIALLTRTLLQKFIIVAHQTVELQETGKEQSQPQQEDSCQDSHTITLPIRIERLNDRI